MKNGAPHGVKCPPIKASSGFTLLEILIVLAIAGLLAGIALPGLHRMAGSLERSSQRNAIFEQIGGLGYQAYASGKPLVIGGHPATSVMEPPIQIPTGWQIESPKPIFYAFNGVCSGGKLTVIAPDQTRSVFHLAPPLCHLTPADERETDAR